MAGTFSFYVEPGHIGPVVVPVGGCSPAVEMPAGPVTITEPLSATTAMVSCSTFPSNRQGPCNTAAQTSTVTVSPAGIAGQTIAFVVNRSTKAKPTISTRASGPTVLGGSPLTDTATLAGGTSPTGTVTFKLYGPNDTLCAGAPVFTASVAVNGKGQYSSAPFAPTAPGVYRWVASYSGDGKDDPVSGACNAANESTTVTRGPTGTGHCCADFDGDGTSDKAVFRPSTGEWLVMQSSGGPVTVAWGTSGDIPAPGDYNGDGTTDIAVFRPSSGAWYIRGQAGAQWGMAGDIPVAGDYNGDGTTDIAVFRPSNGAWYVRGQAGMQLGAAGDIPVPPMPPTAGLGP